MSAVDVCDRRLVLEGRWFKIQDWGGVVIFVLSILHNWFKCFCLRWSDQDLQECALQPVNIAHESMDLSILYQHHVSFRPAMMRSQYCWGSVKFWWDALLFHSRGSSTGVELKKGKELLVIFPFVIHNWWLISLLLCFGKRLEKSLKFGTNSLFFHFHPISLILSFNFLGYCPCSWSPTVINFPIFHSLIQSQLTTSVASSCHHTNQCLLAQIIYTFVVFVILNPLSFLSYCSAFLALVSPRS